MKLGSKEVETGTREITKQVESYEFQVRAIAWQILISLSITLGVFFLGEGNYILFLVGLFVGMVFFAIVVMDYRKIKLNIISRERGMKPAELRRFRILMRSKRYEDTKRFLNNLSDIAPGQKADYFRKMDLSRKLDRMVAEKRISIGSLERMARENGFKLQRDYYKMRVQELEAIVGEVGRMRMEKY